MSRRKAVHTIPKTDRESLLDAISSVDVVVHQPIGGDFVASSKELRELFPQKTFVSFPSIYFAGLIPQLCGLRHYSDGPINGPLGAYHDARIIRSYLRGVSVEECVQNLEDIDPIAMSLFDAMAGESSSKEAELDVKCMDIVLDDYRNQQLFFTFNHPSNSLLWRVVERIAAHLGHPGAIPEQAFPKQFLNGTVSAVPEMIAEKHGLLWRQPTYALGTEQIPNQKVVEDFYKLYSTFTDFADICQRSSTKPNIPIL